MSSDTLDPMSKLNPTNKLFIFLLPIGISMSSFVMGYFIVYFTMIGAGTMYSGSVRNSSFRNAATSGVLPASAVM